MTDQLSVNDLIEGAELAAEVLRVGVRDAKTEQHVAAVVTALSTLAIAKMLREMTFSVEDGERIARVAR